jgi:hypothetical protein
VESDGSGGYNIDVYNPNDPVNAFNPVLDPELSGSPPIFNNPIADPNNLGTKQVFVSNTDNTGIPADATFSNGTGGLTHITYTIQTQAGMHAEDVQDRIHIDAAGNWQWTQNDGQVFAYNLNQAQLEVYPININAVNHSTPFVGPAGTMSLPNFDNGVSVFGHLLAAGFAAFVDGTKPLSAAASTNPSSVNAGFASGLAAGVTDSSSISASVSPSVNLMNSTPIAKPTKPLAATEVADTPAIHSRLDPALVDLAFGKSTAGLA